MIGISTLHFAIRLLLAIAMGAIVGLERQWRQRMAGTRTNALVVAGAAAFVMCGLLLENDPSARGRIVSYVVSGVGFLGAGSSSRMVRAYVGSIRLPRFGVPQRSAHLLGPVLFIWPLCSRSRSSSPTWSFDHWPIAFTPSSPKQFLPKRPAS